MTRVVGGPFDKGTLPAKIETKEVLSLAWPMSMILLRPNVKSTLCVKCLIIDICSRNLTIGNFKLVKSKELTVQMFSFSLLCDLKGIWRFCWIIR